MKQIQHPLLTGEELYRLIPQRPPIVMVDYLFHADNQGVETGLTVRPHTLFCKDGCLREPGIIEHVAQSAAAFAGYPAYTRSEPPRLGFIGEVKKFKILSLPKVGECLYTTLKILAEAEGVTLITAETRTEQEIVATGQMKIFIKED